MIKKSFKHIYIHVTVKQQEKKVGRVKSPVHFQNEINPLMMVSARDATINLVIVSDAVIT